MDADGAKELVNNVDTFLFDCDGVLWDWNVAIDGAVECVNKLKAMGKRCYYVTNNFSKSRQALLTKLQDFGFKDVVEDDIVCTAWAVGQHLKELGFKDKAYLMGTDEAGLELDLAGIRHVGLGPDNNDPDLPYYDYNKIIKLDPEVKCVIVGFDHHLSLVKLSYVSSYLCDDSVLYFAPDTFHSVKLVDSKVMLPGNLGIIQALKSTVAREPHVVGKPSTFMWNKLKAKFGLDEARTCMVGDTLEADILFAKNCNIKYSLAVLSGHTTEKEIKKVETMAEYANHVPEFYANSLKNLSQFL